MQDISDANLDPTQVIAPKNWSARRKIVAFALVPAMLLASIITTIPVVLIYGLDISSIPIAPMLLASVVAEWIVIVCAFGFAGIKGFAKDYLKIHRWWHILVGIASGILCFVGLQAGAALTESIWGHAVVSSTTSSQLAGVTGFMAILVLIGLVSILGPFTEEVLFRGVLVGSLRNSSWKAPWISVLFSAVLFGSMHTQGLSTATDFFVIAWTALMGGYFAILFIWTKSIWTSTAAHITYNLVTSLLLLIGLEH